MSGVLHKQDDEEDDDIDNLVNIHRKTMGDSGSSLRSKVNTDSLYII